MSSTANQSAVYARIRKNPRFTELVSKRTSFATLLSVVVLVIFYGFFMVVAFNPNLIGQRLSEGSYLTVGIAAELFMFIFFWCSRRSTSSAPMANSTPSPKKSSATPRRG